MRRAALFPIRRRSLGGSDDYKELGAQKRVGVGPVTRPVISVEIG